MMAIKEYLAGANITKPIFCFKTVQDQTNKAKEEKIGNIDIG